MNPRTRFALTLGLFAVWIAVLGFLAVTSAEKPQQRDASTDVR